MPLPCPQPQVQSVFQACLHLTQLLWGFRASFRPWLPGLASRGRTQQPAQCTSPWGSGAVLLSRRLEPRALGKGPYMTAPCPPSTRLKAQPSHIGLPLFMCQMAPAHVHHPLSGARAPFPKPCSVHLSTLCAVTAPEEPPLIFCSNNGAPPTPAHPCTTRILKSIDFNEISIPVSELLLCFVWVLQRDKSWGWDETSALSTLFRLFWRPGRRKAKGCDGQDQIPGIWQGGGQGSDRQTAFGSYKTRTEASGAVATERWQ